MKVIRTGSDFSGVGAFDYAIERVISKTKTTEHERVFACDMDKYARIAYIANHGNPTYFPENVYDREIQKESLDIYMTSPPCQSFSLAGKRKGKDDERGILFFNSHEFIQQNKPRFFIFENVKGLLSDDEGRTFQEWCNMLSGKSVNGVPVIFPFEKSVPYHIYWRVLNSKDYGVPQNRERVFIVGIRDDEDNTFSWPRTEPLTKRLKDVLETFEDGRFETVEEFDSYIKKFFLSQKSIQQLLANGTETDHLIPGEVSNTIRVGGGGSLSAKHSFDMIKLVGNTNPSGNGMNGNVFDSEGISPTLSTNKGEGVKIQIKEMDDKIRFHRNDKRKSGIQGMDAVKEHGVADTVTTSHGGNYFDGYTIRRLTPLECLRLQDFPDEHVERAMQAGVSNSQLYKQAGNSITVRVLEKIIEKLPL